MHVATPGRRSWPPAEQTLIYGVAMRMRPMAFVSAAPALAARGLIGLYRYTLSSLVGRTCRHLPTCSEYADEAIARHGLWAGAWMALARFWRCRPFGSRGFDPPPANRPDRARWYAPWRYGRWQMTEQSSAAAAVAVRDPPPDGRSA
jgi:hypothetical protein